MRISAAWLRSISDDIKYCPFNESNDDLEGENSWPNNNWEKRPPVLYVRRSKDENEDANQIYHLQYVFCVFQPKKVAFVSSFFKAHKAFNGWYFLSPQKYLEFENKNFEFVIYDDETSDFHNKNLFKEVRCLSSQRFVNLSELDDSKKSIFMELKSEPDDKKDKLEEAYICLYKHLSERLTDERDKKDEKILIVDEKAEENNKNIKEQLASKIVFEINNQRNDIVYYRYLTHLEEKNEFRQYVINEDPEMDIYPFSEGISGDNSTDRLIRNELLTELWFFKHLYAMKQKIAIFDERIFSLVCGLDESDFANTATSYGSDLMSDIKRLTPIINDEFDKALLKLVDTREKFNDYMKNHNLSFPKYTDRDQVNALNHLGTTYFHKNLFVFSLIPSFDHSDLYNLYGFKTDPQNEQTFSLCVKYATIGWDQNQKRLLFTPYNEHSIEWKKFRTLSSLSIHQGLLDKMYSAFGIKKNDIQTKENLTKDFYEFFIKDSTKHVIEFNDVNGNKRYFLPGMTIHSGRSKPSEEDMPQRLPFIPYSAIEQAVLDCKYSIVELLNSSRYE